MKKSIRYFFPVIFLFGSCGGPKSVKAPERIEHIVIIGVDGMSPDGVRNAATPLMDSMMANGSVKWHVRTVLPSSSSPNWMSMISGAGPEQHGVIDNDWEKTERSLPPVVMDDEDLFPTIFEVIRKNRPKGKIAAVYNWKGFGHLFEKKAVNYDTTSSSVDTTTSLFIDYIKKEKPLFAFIQMDHVDHAGHTYGHGSAEYYQAIGKADSLIGTILEGIRQAGIEKNTSVIVTADHGGKGYGHGGATPEEAEITMILYGKDIKKGYNIQQPVYTYDLAATIAFSLGITPPYAWIGRPVKSAFEGFSEPSNLWHGKTIIASPVIFPKPHFYQEAGGLYIDMPAIVKITSPSLQSVIHYSLDGSEPDSSSLVYKKPFVLNTTTVVKAKSFDNNGNESVTSIAYFRVVKSGTGMGVHSSFFSGKGWKSLPDFTNLKPKKSWISNEIELNRNQILPLMESGNAVFGVVFKGYVVINQPGKYTFYTSSDDGSRLFIDDKEVVDNDGSHGVITKSGDIDLTSGKHSILINYFNSEGGFWLDAFYKGPGLSRQIIPANVLFQNK
ncbi:MAG: alkaline phosphatase family protein [Ginsengibacter sp.]